MSRSISRVLSRTIIHLGQTSLLASSDLPESSAGHACRIPIWSCSEWGLPSPQTVTSCAVRSYRTFSPLPIEIGGFLSAALSVGSRPPGVTWHSTLWSPDFPPDANAERLPDQLDEEVIIIKQGNVRIRCEKQSNLFRGSR